RAVPRDQGTEVEERSFVRALDAIEEQERGEAFTVEATRDERVVCEAGTHELHRSGARGLASGCRRFGLFSGPSKLREREHLGACASAGRGWGRHEILHRTFLRGRASQRVCRSAARTTIGRVWRRIGRGRRAIVESRREAAYPNDHAEA